MYLSIQIINKSKSYINKYLYTVYCRVNWLSGWSIVRLNIQHFIDYWNYGVLFC